MKMKIQGLPLLKVAGLLLFGFIIITGCNANKTQDVSASQIYAADEPGKGRVTLVWDNVLGADSYNVYISKIPSAKQNGKMIRNISNPVTITDLETGTTYYFVVTAVDHGIESAPSDEISHLIER